MSTDHFPLNVGGGLQEVDFTTIPSATILLIPFCEPTIKAIPMSEARLGDFHWKALRRSRHAPEHYYCGLGRTPEEALLDLMTIIQETA